MTPEQEAVVGLVRLLERLGIPHMVTGSVASSYHGRPRLTHDADVVVDPTAGQLEELVSSLLAEGHYVDASSTPWATHSAATLSSAGGASRRIADASSAEDGTEVHFAHE